MPRYYFHLHDHIFVEDKEGVELADVAAVREKAVDAARDMACASIHEGQLNLEHYIRVTDEAGHDITTVTFREAFTIRG